MFHDLTDAHFTADLLSKFPSSLLDFWAQRDLDRLRQSVHVELLERNSITMIARG